MKKNYKIKIDPPPLSSEEIARFKDFDALLKQYQEQPAPEKSWPRLKTRHIAAALAVAAGLALLLFVRDGSTNWFDEAQDTYFAQRPFIDPPFESVRPAFASFKLNASKGGVYEYESGSKLKVPPAAFVDESGEVIGGEVEIKYREFHDYVDFFLSGIPMTYDSAGVTYTLESAGMMEVYAEKDGKRVKMAPGKTIAVELVSNVNVPPHLDRPPRYNIYRLDEEKKAWVYQDIDKMQLIEDTRNMDEGLDRKDPLYPIQLWRKEKLIALQLREANELADIEASIPMPEEPLVPQKNNGSSEVFSFDVSDLEGDVSDEYARAKEEVAAMREDFSSMLWQISPDSRIALEKMAAPEDGAWDGMRLRKVNNRDYELTLIEGNEAIKVLINPVLSGSDYQRAMAKYEQQLETWRAAVQAREAALAQKKTALAAEIEKERAAIEDEYAARVEAFEQKGQDAALAGQVISRKVINRFEADAFGIWNCDRPLPPYMVRLKARFTDQYGNHYDQKTAYLVDKSRNTITRFLATDGTELRFNLNSENLLWVVDGRKIAVFRPENFKRINQPKGSYTFEMELVDKEVDSEETAREILY
ncbi:MAG: OmpH family outer membrane protein, partial [Bacteroidetes bacterium]